MSIRSITTEIAALGPAAAYGPENPSFDLDRSTYSTNKKTAGDTQPATSQARSAESTPPPEQASVLDASSKTLLPYAGERSAPAPSLKLDVVALKALALEAHRASYEPPPTAKDSAFYKNASASEVSHFVQRPEYTQFQSGQIATSLTHSFKPDSTSVTQTALDGPYRFWSLEKVSKRDGSNTELVRDSLGRERYRNELGESGWKITETEYQAKSLWRSCVHEKCSDGIYTLRYYSAGREVGSDTQRLSLLRTA